MRLIFSLTCGDKTMMASANDNTAEDFWDFESLSAPTEEVSSEELELAACYLLEQNLFEKAYTALAN